MDDDQAIEYQLELMHALQTRTLRPVPHQDKPIWVGGQKAPTQTRILGLQKEFLENSMAMHRRLRPQVDRMAEIKKCTSEEQWRRTLRELRIVCQKRNSLKYCVSEPKLLYQLNEVVASRPGWMDLQAEIRRKATGAIHLDPVEVDGFYVVKVFPDGHSGQFSVI